MTSIRYVGATATLALALALVGCGTDFTSEELGTTATGDEPGTGTGTLRVSGHVDATESVDNGATAHQFQVELSVEVWRSTEPVDDAAVAITPAGGPPILLSSAGAGTALYLGFGSGYHESYEIDVTAGADHLTDGQVEGPDIHVFSQPTPGAVVEPDKNLEVRWDRTIAADDATIETNELDETLIADEGSYVLDGAYLEGHNDALEDDRATLRRTNYVDLEGGAQGSVFRVSLRNRVEFQIDLAP
ncbi:MAG: hypothetical protein JRI68_25835 [Deltaproteobacteria bacterium]|nr:hypothetical protein [Deltaproteobacteria bacterium]